MTDIRYPSPSDNIDNEEGVAVIEEPTVSDINTSDEDDTVIAKDSSQDIEKPASLIDDPELIKGIDKEPVYFTDENVEELAELIQKRFAGLSDEQKERLLSPESTWEYYLYQMYMLSSSSEDMLTYLKKNNLSGDKNFIHWLKDENNKVRLGLAKVVDAPSSNKVYNGKAALRKMMKNGQDIYRYTLFNSGIALELRPPTIAEYNSFFQKCGEVGQNYGYMFGGCLILFQDIYLKRITLNFIHKLIINSSLPGWDDFEVFLENVSILDFEPLCIHAAKTTYPKGYDFIHPCTSGYKENGELCKHVSKATINISHLAHTVFSKFNSAQTEHLTKVREDSPVTLEDIREYQNSINLNDTIQLGNIKLKLKIPSLKEYFDSSDKFINKILQFMQEDSAGEEDVIKYIGAHRLSQFLCWIEQIYVYEDKFCTTESFTTTDVEAIRYKLDSYVLPDIDLITELNDGLQNYINSQRCTFVCYPIFKCPECGYMPENTSGFYGVDVVQTFFIIALKKFTAISSGKTITE